MGEVERGLLAGRTTILRAQFASDMQRLMNKAEAEGGQLIGEPFVYEGDLCQIVQFSDESLSHPVLTINGIPVTDIKSIHIS